MLCPNIKHNISWQVDGKVSPCNNIIDFPAFFTVGEMYNSKEYTNLMLDNDRHIKSKYCTRCWDKELLGLTSKRQSDNKLDFVYKKINESYLKVDAAIGKICNAACVICGPHSSSLWQKYIPINQTKDNTEIWSICENQIENLVQIDLGGGEPWLNQIEQQNLLLDKLIASGRCRFVKIRYNTNASLFPTKLLNKLKHFRQVEITVSIDDVEERFEYNRWPLKWNNINSNLRNLKTLADDNENILITINFTVSVFTWLRADNFVKWAKEFGITNINYNILASPKIYSIKHLQVNKQIPETMFDDIVNKEPIDSWSTLFSNKMDLLDKTRNTNWRAVFPELQELINEV